MRLVYAIRAADLPALADDTIPVMLYGQERAPADAGRVGAHAFRSVRRLDQSASATAFDFMTIAMAVTAAETFVTRKAATDGWARDLDLVVPLRYPARWISVRERLTATLRFLTGDNWSLDFREWGPSVPAPSRRRDAVSVAGHDCVCLFSGGLDSAIGAIDLTANGRRPLLVSHAYRDDGPKQRTIGDLLPGRPSHFLAAAYPSRSTDREPDNTMRGRSLNFLAFAAVAASAMQGGRDDVDIDIVVPENGFIGLNPPATLRRLGSLSTRTTHPHFLKSLESILRDVGLPVRLVNPYRHMTKGEMMRGCANQELLRRVAAISVSCGKWKRKREQCGKCLPCLIRRASFYAAGWSPDPTHYSPLGTDLRALRDTGTPDQRGDLLALLRAVGMAETPELERRVALTGPLPLAAAERDPYIDVARRGLREVGALLAVELGCEPEVQDAA